MLRGIKAFQVNNFTEAENAYTESLAYQPDNIDTLIRLGHLQLQQKRVQEALDTFLKIIEIDEDNSSGWYSLGSLYLEMKKFKEAEKAFNCAIQLEPDFAHAWNDLAIALYSQERYYDAEKASLKATGYKPELIKGWSLLINICNQTGNVELEKRAFDKLKELDPSNYMSHIGPGYRIKDNMREKAVPRTGINQDVGQLAAHEFNYLMMLYWPFELVEVVYGNTVDAGGGYVMTSINPLDKMNEVKKQFTDGFEASVYIYNLCMDNQESGQFGRTKVAHIKAKLPGEYTMRASIQIKPNTMNLIPSPKHTLSTIMLTPIQDFLRHRDQINEPLPEMFYSKKIETIMQYGLLNGLPITNLPSDLSQRIEEQLRRYCKIFIAEFPRKKNILGFDPSIPINN